MTSHARKNAARRQQDLTATNRRAALQDIRNAVPPTPQAKRATRIPGGKAQTGAVPGALIALVQDFVRWERRHLDDAANAARQHIHSPANWHRLVLYALTDALAYNFLLVGTLAAYLQEQGLDAELLRRHLQSPDPDRYVNQEALDLLAGLMDRPVAEGQQEPTWHFIGRQIAACGARQSDEGVRQTQ
ncbi:hypothetical protein [Streptomyces sp. NRRL F-5650]|uniref:hypothetical protein n=1 Tax=Streptomyces sp. NRRL F-5650 TaxID=1463868 RepID=UPI0007C53AE6|nr:hypothetical protein [Streptomyces sp. NRRL F-5650]